MVRDVGGDEADVTAASIEAMHDAARAVANFAPDTLVVISPHSPPLGDAFVIDTAPDTHGTLAQFGAARTAISARTDVEFASRLIEAANTHGLPARSRAGHSALQPGVLDHGVLVPLLFLDPKGTYPLVNISLSGLSLEAHRRLGEVVAEVARSLGRRIVFLASGDLSHRLTPRAPAGYSAKGQEFDSQVVELLRTNRLTSIAHIDPSLADAAGECGWRSIIALSGAMPQGDVQVLSYEGPWGVGYLVAVVREHADDSGGRCAAVEVTTEQPRDESSEHELVRLARHAIVSWVEHGVEPEPSTLSDPSLPVRAGTFVSLHLDGHLRGCIGTIAPTQRTLAAEVVHNAVQAASADPRFPAVTADEVDRLDVKVDVLYPPEGCSFEDLDPEQYGVIVSCGWRRGLLLPDLEGVDSSAEQVDIARKKAGISPSEPCSLERFRVDRYA
jgi:AmmeMemoRadiSam system protein A